MAAAAPDTRLLADAGAIAAFVNALFPYAGSGRVVLRTFVEGANKPPSIKPVSITAGLANLIALAVSEAQHAADSVAPTVFCPPLATFENDAEPWRAREQDLAEGLALSVELDKSPARGREALESILGPATVVVASGGEITDPTTGEIEPKLHLHWRLSEPATGADLARLKDARRHATMIAGGDPSNVPMVHPIRWPGSWHRKGAPRLATIAALDPTKEIHLCDAVEALSEAVRVRPVVADASAPGAADNTPVTASEADLVRNIIEGRDLHDSVARLAASWLMRGVGGGATVATLRGLMEGSAAPRDDRWRARYDDIPRAVSTAQAKFGPAEPIALQARAEVQSPAPVLDLMAWKSSRFQGEPPEIKYLVSGSVPLGVPALVVAQGDTGKSMALLELGRRVAFGSSVLEPFVFGGAVACEGAVVILTSEDDEGAVHRRLAALDARNARFTARGERLIVVPLPNAGGAFPIFREGPNGMEVTDRFRRLKDQLAAIPDLRLIAFDPMQAFVHGPINEDPAAGQFACTAMGALAAETGATAIFAHHMRKTLKPIETLQDARDGVRGTTAIVDGVRFAFALWPVEPDKAKPICQELQTPFEHNKIVRGGVIKANGPARRVIRTYCRNKFGLLLDVTSSLIRTAVDQSDELDALVEAIKGAAERGRPFTKTGLSGLFDQRERLPPELRKLSKHGLVALAQDGLNKGLIVQAIAEGSRNAKWLDIPTGPFATGAGEFIQGGEVVECAE